jgi:hypothetical protein
LISPLSSNQRSQCHHGCSVTPRHISVSRTHGALRPSFHIFDELRQEFDDKASLRELRTAVLTGDRSDKWQGVDRLILVHGRVYVPPDSPCLMAILTGSHGMGHKGAEKMLHLLRADLFVPNAHMVVCDHVRSCSTCQKNKTEQLHLAGLLQPLPVPSAVWCDIVMDFIEGLLRINDKSVILTVVDQLSRYVHFITLGHPYTATSVGRAFFDSIARLHGVPGSIVSDRDSVFTSKFWTMLFTLADVRLNMTTTFHPQADGQTEATNKIIVMYLCCLTGDQPQHWLQWLP